MSMTRIALASVFLLGISGCVMDAESDAFVDEGEEEVMAAEQAEAGDEALAAEIDAEFELTSAGGTSSAIAGEQLDLDKRYDYSGGLFGISYNKVFGHATCLNGRKRSSSDVSKISGTGWCAGVGWYSSVPTDCRIVVHFGANAFEAGTCKILVYSVE